MKIICIGRNYGGQDKGFKSPLPEVPLFFVKPDTALLRTNTFYLPPYSSNIHYEIELAVKIKKVGKCISKKFAPNYYDEISLGLDFTARDLLDECIKKGMPWEIAKGFDSSAPIGQWYQKKGPYKSRFLFIEKWRKSTARKPLSNAL